MVLRNEIPSPLFLVQGKLIPCSGQRFTLDVNINFNYLIVRNLCSLITHLFAISNCPCRWLQYHDRDTGDLCGMLPLAIGMKVALTQHLDRSQDKLLLKGTVGRPLMGLARE